MTILYNRKTGVRKFYCSYVVHCIHIESGCKSEKECRSRMVEMSLVLVGFRPGPGSSFGRAPAASAGVPGSIPGWCVLAFFHPAELHLLRSFLLSF